jgi:hypothetical protein
MIASEVLGIFYILVSLLISVLGPPSYPIFPPLVSRVPAAAAVISVLASPREVLGIKL